MYQKLKKFLSGSIILKNTTTVRYAFPVLVMTAVMYGIASLVSSTDSYVTIKTPSTTVTKDSEFYIDVSAYAHVAVNAVDIQIDYPEKTIAIEGIDTGSSVITLWTEQPYAKDGIIYMRGGTYRKGFVGEHTIARIKAKAIADGDARIVIRDTQLIAGDGKGTPVTTSKSDLFNQVVVVVTPDADGAIKAQAELNVVTDINGDGNVNLTDISSFMGAWFAGDRVYDFNGDGKMTFKDFSIILAKSFSN